MSKKQIDAYIKSLKDSYIKAQKEAKIELQKINKARENGWKCSW